MKKREKSTTPLKSQTKLLFVLISFLVPNQLFAQLTGTVTNEQKQPIVGASVSIENADRNIIAFSITDENGLFSFQETSGIQTNFTLFVRHLNYKTYSQQIEKISQEDLTIQLTPDQNVLSDVIVEYNIPIKQTNDTIQYSVEAFKDSTDLVIGDVIDKLPGVDVDEDGNIFYQGKEISTFYIEDADLLGDGYNLASDNIRANDVQSVEVYENHQHIKMLQNKFNTDNVAMNLNLKKKVVKTGTGKLKSGASPLLWNSKVNGLLFSEKIQTLSVLQTNNTGKNLTKYSQAINLEDINRFTINKLTNPFRTINSIQQLQFKDPRWLRNESILLTPNILIPLKNDFSLRINHQSLWNQSDYEINKTQQFITPNGTIRNDQIISENLKSPRHQLSANLEKNTSNFYLNNSLKLGYYTKQLENSIEQDIETYQYSNRKDKSVSNQFSLYFPVKNNILLFKSQMYYSNYNDRFSIKNGQFSTLNEYTDGNTNQLFKNSQSLFNHTLKFKSDIGANTSLSVKGGVRNENSKINNDISDENNEPLPPEYHTNKSLHSDYIFIEPELEWLRGIFQIKLLPRVSMQTHQLNSTNGLSLAKRKLYPFHPKLTTIITPNAKFKFSATTSYNQSVQPLSKQNINFFITDYQNLTYSNTKNLNRVERYSFGTNIQYKNIFSSVFANLRFTYSNRANEYIKSTSYDGNGLKTVNYLPESNQSKIFRIGMNLNKADLNNGNNYKLQLNYLQFQNPIYLNQQLKQIVNSQIMVSANSNLKISEKLKAEISGDLFLQRNKSYSIVSKSNTAYLQAFFHYFPNNENIFTFHSNIISNTLQDDFFIFSDISYRNNVTERLTILADVNNIFNMDSFTDIVYNLNEIQIENHQLRPRQFLVGISAQF